MGLGLLAGCSTSDDDGLGLVGTRDGEPFAVAVPWDPGEQLEIHYMHSYSKFDIREVLARDDTGRCEGFAVVDQLFEDLGAGIGEVPGEAAMVDAEEPEGWLHLEGLHRCIGDEFTLRVGWIADQKLVYRDCVVPLAEFADEGTRLTLHVDPEQVATGERIGSLCDLQGARVPEAERP